MNRQQKGVIKSFIEYKQQNDKLIAERDILLEQWAIFEKAYMLKSPVLEVEFAHDDRSPLSLYDCLIPKLREHRQLKIRPELYLTENLICDMQAKKIILEIEHDLEKKRFPVMKAEVQELETRVL